MIDATKEGLWEVRDLDLVFCVCYPILFQKDMEKGKIITLIDSES